ncbi:hypothetical protein [Ruegeria sp. HKCCD7318]|nr:hypothetical protein [Ruegeria sp. HKCCD7318]
MLIRLIIVLVVLYFGYQFAAGTLQGFGLALSETFAWMFEDY